MHNDYRLKKMGLVLTLILAVITSLFYFKHLLFMAFLFLILLAIVLFQLLFYTKGLSTTEKVLLKTGDAFGWINSRILLGFLFYLVMTPIGLCLKILRKQTIATGLDPNASTYWEKDDSRKTPESYKRQF